MPEDLSSPEQQPVSPTEASNTWRVNYAPSFKQVAAGALAFTVGVIGWSQGHIDLGVASTAMSQGVFSEAALKGLLGVVELTAGAAGALGLGVWAKRANDRQLDTNPKPQ